MAGPLYFDRVLETTNTTGTGTVTLLGAQQGHQAFSDRLAEGDTCYYVIAEQSGSDWEVGLGTFHSAGPTLARTTVLESSNADALVSFASGTKNVFLDFPADRISQTAFLDTAQEFTAQQRFDGQLAALPDIAFPSGVLAYSVGMQMTYVGDPNAFFDVGVLAVQLAFSPSVDVGGSGTDVEAFRADLVIPSTSTKNLNCFMESQIVQAINKGSGNVSYLIGQEMTAIHEGSGTVHHAYGQFISVLLFGTGHLDTGAAIFIPAPSVSGGGTVDVFYAIYVADMSSSGASNNYYLWFDAPGVFRVKNDGVMAYYNPGFSPKYTPGGTDFERVVQQWTSNVIEYGTEKGTPTSVLRSMRLISNTVQVALAGASAPDLSAQFQVDSTTRGFLPPRMTTTQRNAIVSPATGLIVYNTSLSEPEFWDGATWQAMTGGAGAVSSVSNSDGSLTISPTTGAVVASLNLGHSNAWTVLQSFTGTSTDPTIADASGVYCGTNGSPRVHLVYHGNTLWIIDNDLGDLRFIYSAGFPAVIHTFKVDAVFLTGGMILTSPASGTVAEIVRGASSQTADLQQWQDSTPTTLSRVTAAGWLQNAPGRARLTGNATNATATMSNLTDLTLTLVAGRKYTGKLVLFAKNSTASEGLQFDLNGGAATFTSIFFGFAALPPTTGVVMGIPTSTAAGTAISVTTASNGDAVYTIEIAMVVNAGGTFIPRFAEVTSTSGTATVELGSYLWLEDMPN